MASESVGLSSSSFELEELLELEELELSSESDMSEELSSSDSSLSASTEIQNWKKWFYESDLGTEFRFAGFNWMTF